MPVADTAVTTPSSDTKSTRAHMHAAYYKQMANGEYDMSPCQHSENSENDLYNAILRMKHKLTFKFHIAICIFA